MSQNLVESGFEELSDKWSKELKVTFIGEDAMDAGGVMRDLFTAFFLQCPLGFSTSPKAEDLRSEKYCF